METDACATGEHIRMSFFSAATVWGLFRDGFGPEKFRHGASQCREAIGKLLDQDRSTDADKVLVNILTYLDKQLARAYEWIEGDLDLLAFITRSILEIHFWAVFITQSEENLKQFIRDERNQLWELYKKATKAIPDLPQLSEADINKRLKDKRIDSQQDLLYAQCSKYIHTSSFILNNLQRLEDDVAREMFGKFILAWAWRTLEDTRIVNWRIGESSSDDSER
jgi:glutaredoxin-related protein